MDAASVSPRRNAGFTLVELMAVLAIVAVLLAIALPAYQGRVLRTHRIAAQAEMLRLANLQHQYLLSNRRFMDTATARAAGFALKPAVARHYRFAIETGSGGAPEFLLRFVPRGAQAPDGELTLDDQGRGKPDGKWL